MDEKAQVTFCCDGCGAKESGVFYRNSQLWGKPSFWFTRSDDDGVQLACSRKCIDVIANRSGKTSVVLPI